MIRKRPVSPVSNPSSPAPDPGGSAQGSLFLSLGVPGWALALLVMAITVWVSLGGGATGPAAYLGQSTGWLEVLSQARWERAGQAAVAVTLPHRMPGPLAHAEVATYTVPFTVPASHPTEASAGVCVVRWSYTAEVLLEGERLLGQPSLNDARDYSRPHFVALPPGLSGGPHELTLRMTVLPEMDPGLSEIWFGEGDLVRKACNKFAESKRDRAFGPAFMMGVMGLAALLLWRLMRERSALWLMLMSALWVFHFVHLTAVWMPMTVNAWSLLYFASRMAFALPLYLFCLRFLGHDSPALERGLTAGFGVAGLLLVLVPAPDRARWLVGMALACLLLAFWILPMLLRYALRQGGLAGYALLASLALMFAASVLDLARWVGLVPYGTTSLSYLAVPALSAAFLLLLIDRLLRQARREGDTADQLRHEEAAQREKTQAEHDALHHQRERMAVLDERRRIVRDMHDGLGTQLVSASAELRSAQAPSKEQAAGLVDKALVELRSVLDVLAAEPARFDDEDPVSPLLGTLRRRVEPVLAAQGVTLEWHSTGLPNKFLERDAERLNLLRLLQESFTNVIRHAQASRVVFEVISQDGLVTMTLKDNGKGLSDNTHERAGLQSMRMRALALKAELSILSPPGQGTTVKLRWVLEGAR